MGLQPLQSVHLQLLNQFEEAIDNLQLAIKFSDHDAIILEHLGDAYQAISDFENAQLYWGKALEKDADNSGLKEKLQQYK